MHMVIWNVIFCHFRDFSKLPGDLHPNLAPENHLLGTISCCYRNGFFGSEKHVLSIYFYIMLLKYYADVAPAEGAHVKLSRIPLMIDVTVSSAKSLFYTLCQCSWHGDSTL
jgi:hypothetical protein